MEDEPVFEMRPPTPGEQEQIEEMERRYGRGGRADWSGLLGGRWGEDLHAADGTKEIKIESINLSSLDEVHGTACAWQGPEFGNGDGSQDRG